MRSVNLLLGSLFVLAVSVAMITPRYEHPSTWSIVAADPTTGEVGVASASCVPQPIDALAAVVPGQGVAATQAAFTLENRDRVFELLKQGESAENIITTVTSEDTNAGQRQYGVITLNNGVATIAGFTGDSNGDWAGDQQSESILPVTVQGNILEDEAVVTAALDAFNDPTLGESGNVLLSDRLIRALEAGSAAGGDKRCNRVVQQTASAAFIIVAQGDEQPFAIADFGESVSDDSPTLHLSVTNGVGGANPIIELRQQYDQWRETHADVCESCNPTSISVPGGGSDAIVPIGTLLFLFPTWAVLLCGGVLLLLAGLSVRWLLRRKR